MRMLLAIAVAILVAGCAAIGPQAEPAPMPECAADEFAFVGETSLAALGLNEFGGPEASRVGMIWVTAGPVSMDFGPVPDPKFQPPPAMRMVCVQWPDGSGMAGSVEDGWQPPAGIGGSGAVDDSEVPWSVIALGAGAVVLIGVSVIAFRREPA